MAFFVTIAQASIALALLSGTAVHTIAEDRATGHAEEVAKKPTEKSTEEAAPFQPSDHLMADVDGVLTSAQASGKKALIVMGANWCHDSQGLVRRLETTEVRQVLDAHYELLLVDVNYYDMARAVNQRFGMPAIYATPTVMIVDPASEKLLNADTMHIWRDADSISLEDTQNYFIMEANQGQGSADISPLEQAFYDEIAAFERREAERLLVGYDTLGPLMRESEERGQRPDGLMALWGSVRDFRYQLTDDVLRLRRLAREKAEAGDDSPLVFPTYPAASWENS